VPSKPTTVSQKTLSCCSSSDETSEDSDEDTDESNTSDDEDNDVSVTVEPHPTATADKPADDSSHQVIDTLQSHLNCSSPYSLYVSDRDWCCLVQEKDVHSTNTVDWRGSFSRSTSREHQTFNSFSMSVCQQ